MTRFAPLPPPPYYAVIFSSQRGEEDRGYGEMAARLEELAEKQSGFLGMETTRDQQGFGITVSYWKDEESILSWKGEATHLLAQKLGKTRWYEHYRLRIARVERAYGGPEGR